MFKSSEGLHILFSSTLWDRDITNKMGEWGVSFYIPHDPPLSGDPLFVESGIATLEGVWGLHWYVCNKR